ncbi:MAG: mechanosensitive ion channel [Hyphomicrobiaceae bacterium]
MTTLTGTDDGWLGGSIVLLVLFPVLTVALQELATRLEGGAFGAWCPPIRLLLRTALPALFVMILLRHVVSLPGDHIAVRIADTAFWILIANVVLAAVNVLFFGDGGQFSTAPKLLLDLLRFFLVLIAAAIVVSTVWGVDLGRLLTALGVGSIVIGLALQDTLGSIFSGIAILSARPFRVGDWINFANVDGKVLNMSWRSITIETLAGDRIIVPNGMMARGQVTVFGAATGLRWGSAEVTVSYEHPPQQVVDVLKPAAAAATGVAASPAPVVQVVEYGDIGIRYAIRFPTEQVGRIGPIRAEVMANAWYALQRAGIVLPGRNNRMFQARGHAAGPEPTTAAALAAEIAASGALPRPAEALVPLVGRARRLMFRAGEVIAGQGESGHPVLAVIAGTMTAAPAGAPASAPPVHTFRAGQLLAFKEMLHQATTPFEIRAASEVVAIALPIADFRLFISTDPALAAEVEDVLSTREATAAPLLAGSADAAPAGALQNRAEILQRLFGLPAPVLEPIEETREADDQD